MKSKALLVGLYGLISFSCGPLEEQTTEPSEERERRTNSLAQADDPNAECQGSSGENPMPDGPCIEAADHEKDEILSERKFRELREVARIAFGNFPRRDSAGFVHFVSATSENDEIIDVRLTTPFPIIKQKCWNWCGPAATQMVLHYFRRHASQDDIKEAERAGECDVKDSGGTAIEPILKYLNAHIAEMEDTIIDPMSWNDPSGQFTYTLASSHPVTILPKTVVPYSGHHIGPDPEDEKNNAKTLITMVITDVVKHNQPVIVLINETPPQKEYIFPGFFYKTKNLKKEARRAHYVLLIGYKGNYDGSDDSAQFIFRESSTRNGIGDRIIREEVSVNAIIAELESNNGHGGMSKENWNVLY